VYALTPSKIYMLDRVRDDPVCLARMHRMLSAIGRQPESVVRITEDNLPEAVEELASFWPPAAVPDGAVRSYMRPLVFTTIDLSHRRPDLAPLLKRCPTGTALRTLSRIYGHFTTAVDQHPHQHDQQRDMVCWPTFNLGTMCGCPHGCTYCPAGREGKFIAVGLNLEEYMEKVVGPVIELYPWNKVFRMILDGADLITFEPEYGLHELFARKLAEYEGRWGHFHTNSANVAWLADVPHRDRLVGVWSTACDAMARDFEPGAGSAAERIEAMRLCQEMGIPVRIKFKPVIPVVNWRQEYASIIDLALRRTRPESIGFGMYMWHTYDEMARTLDLSLLDPHCVDAARESADAMKGVVTGPFPHEVRREIYRHLIREVRRRDKDVLLYVSTESREMWDDLKDELGQDPRCYICGCSSVAVPGRKLALSPAFRYSTYHPTPL